MLEEFLDLFLPVRCVNCNRPPAVLCAICAGQINLAAHPVRRGSLIGAAVVDYSPDVAHLIEKFKEHGVTSLAKHFAKPIANHLASFVSDGDSLISPPSSPSSSKRRGYQPAFILAKEVAKALNAAGAKVVAPRGALKLFAAIQDQSQLSAKQRFQNLSGAMAGAEWLAGRSVVLIDDIVTTGATLLECQRAVEKSGGFVKYFSTFAETKSKMDTQSSNWV